MIDINLMTDICMLANYPLYYLYDKLFDDIAIDILYCHRIIKNKDEKLYRIYEESWDYKDEYGSKKKWYSSFLIGSCFSMEFANKFIENRKQSLKKYNRIYEYGKPTKYDLFRKYLNRKYSIKYHR